MDFRLLKKVKCREETLEKNIRKKLSFKVGTKWGIDEEKLSKLVIPTIPDGRSDQCNILLIKSGVQKRICRIPHLGSPLLCWVWLCQVVPGLSYLIQKKVEKISTKV